MLSREELSAERISLGAFDTDSGTGRNRDGGRGVSLSFSSLRCRLLTVLADTDDRRSVWESERLKRPPANAARTANSDDGVRLAR